MLNNRLAKLNFALLSLLLLTVSVQAQNDPKVKENSPYSRFGLGDLFQQNFASQQGMGGVMAAWHDPLQMNLLNPASLGYLEATTFDAGLYGKYSLLTEDEASTTVWSGNLSYLSLGFTLRNRINDVLERRKKPFSWGMNFALVPYSNVGYGVKINSTVDTFSYQNLFSGNGGTYRFYWGNGVRYKNFSAGINLGYFFGKISSERHIALQNQTSTYQITTENEISLSGLYWNIGLMYDYVFKKQDTDGSLVPTGKTFTVGLFGNSPTGFNTNTSLLEVRSNPDYGHFNDTIVSQTGLKQEGTMPAEFSLGVVYSQVNEWRLGANYTFTGWNGYENEAKPEDLSNTWEASIGGEYVPDHLSYNNYFDRVRYRVGFFYRKDPRFELKSAGVTVGFGFPIILPRQTISYINLALEGGRLTGDEGGLDETFARMTLGFSLSDNSWFFKRKFN